MFKDIINLLRSFFQKPKVNVKLQGGLGNQLFQIAAGLHYGKKHNLEIVFSENEKLHDRVGAVGGYTYWDIFNSTNLLKLETIKEKRYVESKFNEFPVEKTNKNLMLVGYYQSEKYTNFVRDEMIEVLWSNEEVSKNVINQYENIVNHYRTDELISLHIRRGDYLKLPNYHTNLSLDYYVKAVKEISVDFPLIIFSDDQEWCKENLSKELSNPLFFISEKDYVELLLMSKIKHNIIANSSFSWWSAYINDNEGKKVIAPQNWFGHEARSKDWSSIYCEGWKVI